MKKILGLLIGSTMVASSANAADVRSLSREITSDVQGVSAWTVLVTCAEVDDQRVIERRGRRGQWCATELPTLCSKQKMRVAERVCSTHFPTQVAQYREAQGLQSVTTEGQATDALAERAVAKSLIEIEQEKLMLEEQQLKARMRELQRKKQAAKVLQH